MPIKVSKFGGTSLASADTARQVIDIMKADADRKIFVPSAPGKRFPEDTKVTDLLYSAAAEWQSGKNSPSFRRVKERFRAIRKGLSLPPFEASVFREIEATYRATRSIDYLVSRGEYLMGKIMAEAMGFVFCDAIDTVFLDAFGYTDTHKTRTAVMRALHKWNRIVVPGFYAADVCGRVKLFSRGGSDITGAILAEAADAYLYENFTDVSGVYAASPRIVTKPKVLSEISYSDLRALSRFGATVLHEDAVFPVLRSMIPIRIKNTFASSDVGTLVHTGASRRNGVVGISGKDGYHCLSLRRDMLGHTPTLHERIFSFFRERGIYPEQIAFSSDSVTLLFVYKFDSGEKKRMLTELSDVSECDELRICDDLMLVTVVGCFSSGSASAVIRALRCDEIPLLYFSGGRGDANFFFAVPSYRGNDAVSAVYRCLFS